ncbi:MAG TPA: murein biosynthesis integral membrane protein MurJ [Egibacteraceae bacterium]|nr:murein biosynthesis integral membrane protein MurJ [Egibacteraceae bacterium]
MRGEVSELSSVPGEPPVPEGASPRRYSNVLAAGILLSRVSGFARGRAIAHFLGTSFAADAYWAAIKIPNLLQNLLGEGVLSASFIPVYSRLLAEGRREEAGRVAGAIAGLLAAATGALVVLGVVFAGPLTSLIAPGFEGGKRELTVAMVRIITPGLGLLALSAWCLGVLNSHRRFFLSYVAPVIWNATQIAVLVALGLTVYSGRLADPFADPAAFEGLALALGWGTLAGGLLQFAIQIPAVVRVGGPIRLSVRADLPGTRAALRAIVPVVAGRGIVQISAWVDLILASLLAGSAVAFLGYSQLLYLLPISLFGMSVAAAELPQLASADQTDRALLTARLDQGLARIAFFVVPSALVYVLLGDLVVGALFQTGGFGSASTMVVWAVLAGYSAGLLATTSSRLLQSSLYAAGETKIPAAVAGLRVTVSAVLGAALMLQFDRLGIVEGQLRLLGELPALAPYPQDFREAPDWPRLGAVGLSLAAGGTAWLEYSLLRAAVRRRRARPRLGGGYLSRTLGAAGAAAVAALAARWMVGDAHPLAAAPIALAATGLVYLAVAKVLRLPEAEAAIGALSRLAGRSP